MGVLSNWTNIDVYPIAVRSGYSAAAADEGVRIVYDPERFREWEQVIEGLRLAEDSLRGLGE